MELSWLLGAAVLLPGVIAVALGLGWLLGVEPSERSVARLSNLGPLAGVSMMAALWLGMSSRGEAVTHLSLGTWFTAGHYRFPLLLVADRLSLPFLALSMVLVGVVASFSLRYLHREPGYLRFFWLLHLFWFGIMVLFAAGSFDLLIVGWELVGLTSFLLVAFFQHREEPVRNGLRIFAIYRACDIGLLTGVAVMHHRAGTADYATLASGRAAEAAGEWSTVIGLLLLLAAMGKAAQVPFSGWLPRAMEGPTPSSAIFYGALSVHAGAYLLLRAWPLFSVSPLVIVAVVGVGLTTALYGTLVGRAAADAKTSLAYAALTQVGLIFVEIGLGWHSLAALHVCGHAAVRTLEFLRAPSALHDCHQLHAAAGGHLQKPGSYYELLLPAPVRAWLYRLAFDRGHLDQLMDRLAVGPLFKLARLFHEAETRWIRWAFGPYEEPEPQLVGRTGIPSSRKPVDASNA